MTVLTWVDHRLLHGQVALSWTQTIDVDCISIANDDVPTNEIRKTTIKLTEPQGIKLVIKSIDDSIVAPKSGVIDKYRLFIVVESIGDTYRLAEAYPKIRTINLGEIEAKFSIRSIGKAVNILLGEEERLKRLVNKQIGVGIRQVPANKKVDIGEVL